MTEHRFAIGQRVRLVGEVRPVANSDYEIMARLPPNGFGEYQYRIRSASEAHERVSLESSLIARDGGVTA
jgi:hypothetical protein